MATFSDIRAIHGLQGVGTLAADNHSGTITIGLAQTNTRLTAATKIFSFNAVIVGVGSSLVVDVSDMDSTGSTAFTAGAAQVDTATISAASGVTSNGTMTLVVTAAGMTGSPKNIAVDLTTTAHTTAALIAQAAVAALNADADYSAMFTATQSSANIITTRNATSTYTVAGVSVPVYPTNDATLNIAIPSGLGISAAATSTNTTTGVSTSGIYAPELDGKDFEGATGGLTDVYGVLISVSDSSTVKAIVESASTELVNFLIDPGNVFLNFGNTAITHGDYTISPNNENDQSCLVSVTITGT